MDRYSLTGSQSTLLPQVDFVKYFVIVAREASWTDDAEQGFSHSILSLGEYIFPVQIHENPKR